MIEKGYKKADATIGALGFKGVENVISYKGNDGLTRYTTGSFSDYEKAVSYMYEMRARGFDDAFIVTYKNGKRINLYTRK